MNFNTNEYWSIFIACFWFFITLALRLTTNVGPVDLKVWYTKKDFIDQITNTNFFITQLVLITLTYICLNVYHKFINLEINNFKYLFVIFIVYISKITGEYLSLKSIGLGKSFWCILLGFFLRLVFGLDSNGMMSMETFIKISIILFAIDLTKVVNLGWKALLIAWLEPILLILLLIVIGYFLKLNKTQSLLLSTGISICGSSAIMSIADILDSNIPNLEYDTSMSITILTFFSIPYMLLLPYLSKYFKFSDTISGIWIGGSIDSTGNVIASASLINEFTTTDAVILKMLQNLLIGPVTLIITGILYKSYNPKILLTRFPKFIIGFISISIIVTILKNNTLVKDTEILSQWFSEISFVLIGMNIYIKNTDFTLYNMIILYIIGQTIDTFTTLGLSIILFN